MSGANSGVVAEVAEEMARQGAFLAILSPDAEEASALASRIQVSSRIRHTRNTRAYARTHARTHTALMRRVRNRRATRR
jgi:NAD(P)-dependent dehydrogenase (short-subunit alcohol dehydrogenase family)